MNRLKQNPKIQLNYLNDLTAYDVVGRSLRLTVTYILTSIKFNTTLHLHTKVGEVDPAPSITAVYNSACWSEREVWDMFGVFFKDHPDLRRILTDYNFSGHPLRKDFPVSGYSDLFFDEKDKKTVYAPIELTQEYRKYKYLSN